MRGVGGRGRGASPPGSPLAGSPVTRNAEIDPTPPPPKMTQGVMTPPNPPSSPSTASLSRVARCWHSNAYFSLFSSLLREPTYPMFAGGCLDARTRQQLRQCRPKHERVDDRINAVQHPAEPRSPETDDLLPVERRAFPDGWCDGRNSARSAVGHSRCPPLVSTFEIVGVD